MKHELKTWPVAFDLALSGAKMFEIRVNDRNFQVGDELLLCEYDLATDRYTGREIRRKVTCVVTGWGLPDGTCALGVAYPDSGWYSRDDLTVKHYAAPASAPAERTEGE